MDLGGFGDLLGGEGAGELVEGLLGAFLGERAMESESEPVDIVYEHRLTRRDKPPNVNDI